jgi:predicted kinase
MSKIYFICGFIGSGKTTYSKKLAELENAFRFSIDEWMIPLFGEHMERDVFNTRLATLQELFKESALQLTKIDVPVIFDFGFWTKADREEFALWAKENELDCEFHYLDVHYDECKERALERNMNLKGHSYEMTPEMLEMFWSWFEVPEQHETVKRISC